MARRILLQALLLTLATLGLGDGNICGFPGSPASGSVWPAKDLYGKGESVSYQCSEGFILIGTAVRRCDEDGEWTGETPLCDDRMVTTGKSLSTETLPGYPSDLALDGNPSTCAQMKRKKPRWWRMDMGERHHVMSVSITVASTKKQRQFTVYVVQVVGTNASYKRCASFNGRFGSKTAVLSCAESKGLEGQFVHIEDNLQEDIFEICEVEVQVLREKYKCGDPDREPYSNHTRPKKGRVHYFCAQGYELDGMTTRECLPSGQWSGAAPDCRPIVCEGLIPLPNGQLKLSVVNGNLPLAGTTVMYGCNLGHVLVGEAMRVCQKDGSWAGVVPYCKAIDCGRPDGESVRGVYRLLNRTTKYGGLAELACRGDGEMEGDDPYITCTLEGKWTKAKATCVLGAGAVVRPTFESEIKNRGAVTFGMVVAVMMVLTVGGTYYYVKRIRTPALPPKPGQLPQPGDAIVPFQTPPPVDRSIPKPYRYRMQPYGEAGVPMPSGDEEKPDQPLENGTMRSLNSSWKTRSLPTDSSAAPKEHLYEEIGQARRSRSDTLDSADLTSGEEAGEPPPPPPLYSSIDVERKRFSRLNRSPDSESPEPRTQTEDITDESMSATPLTSTLDSETTPIQMRELPPIPTEEESSRGRGEDEEEEEDEEIEELGEEEERSAVTPSPSTSPLGEEVSPRPKTVTPTLPQEESAATKTPRDRSKQRPTSPEERKSTTRSPTPPVRDRSKQRPSSPKEQERTESPMPPTRDRSKQRTSASKGDDEKKSEEPSTAAGRWRRAAKEKEEPAPSGVRSQQQTSPPEKEEDKQEEPKEEVKRSRQRKKEAEEEKKEEPAPSRVRSRQRTSPPKEEDPTEAELPALESSVPKSRRKREAKGAAPEAEEPRDWRRYAR